MNWNESPFLRLTSCIIIGIWINSIFTCSNSSCYLLLLLSAFIFCFYFLSYWKSSSIVGRKVQGFFGLSSFILMGYLSAQISYSTQKPSFSHEEIQATTHYTATILSKAIQTSKTTKYETIIGQLNVGGSWTNGAHKAVLYFISDSVIQFSYGEKVLVKSTPRYFKQQTNPYAFDYSKYMSNNGFYLHDFVSSDKVICVNTLPRYSINFFSFLVGDFFEQTLSHYISEDRELNMIKAMALGRRDEITSEMEYVYQSTGTSHILAVSGLHVGIIFLIFSTLLKSMKNKRLKWLYYSLILASIWSFAFITGNSPSVLRASLMITIVLVAEILSRKSNIYNSILVSAFALLLVNPNLLFSVSFQLSYVAVFGIVYLYNKIYRLLYIKYRVINFFWKITALSISAQIATLPITVYYFHHIPTLSLITNLIAIPTAAIVIIGSLMILGTQSFGIIPKFIGYVLEGWVNFYNEIMSSISRANFATIDDIFLKSHFVFLIFLLLIFLIRFIEENKLYYFRIFTFVFVLTAGLVFFNNYKNFHQKEIVFYDVQGKPYIDVFLGYDCFTNIKPNDTTNNDIQFNITPNRMYHQISNTKSFYELKTVTSFGKNTLLYQNNISIFFLEDPYSISEQSTQIQIDYLVIGEKAARFLGKNPAFIKYKKLIMDATINEKIALSIVNKIGKSSKIHSISKDGAYIISI